MPARGGSKGVPGKNLRQLAGKPLIAWTIEAARESRLLDRVVLSTDDGGIAEVARRWGCEVPFMRPPALATDQAAAVDVVLHALEQVPGFGVVVLLQPTSPLRATEDIDGALRRFENTGAPACVSVTEAEASPFWMYRVDDAHRLHPIMGAPAPASRRQDLPKVYVLNGAVYVADCLWLARTRAFVTPETVAYPMPRPRSIDIDTDLDLAIAETFLQQTRAYLRPDRG